MGLRCSILGHTFDETEVRRDRRERGSGNEVVTVVSQIERCSRCGAERVVSENKEVVSVVDADEVGLDERGDAGTGTPRSGPDETGGADPEAAGSDANAEPSPTEPAGEPSPGTADTASEPGPEPESGADASEEDVEFITETEGSLGGGEDVAEEVPDAEDAEGGIGGMAARSGAFEASDEADTAADEAGVPEGEDAEILDAPETERAPGQWPDEPDEEPWEPEALDEESEATGGPSADPAPEVEPAAEPSFTVPEGSLRCPDCGHEVSADSSFRAGDACPECQTGYLEDAGE